MSDPRRSGPAVAMFALAWLLTGCVYAGASSSSPTSLASVPPAAEGSIDPRVEPTIEIPPPIDTPVQPPVLMPPAAFLAVEGGDPVEGQLGSFTWMNTGSDGPWLKGAPIHVGAGERFTVTLAEAVGVATWTASRSTVASLGFPITGLGQGDGQPITFLAPPPGHWSVMVSIWFVDGLGQGSYFWLVEVE